MRRTWRIVFLLFASGCWWMPATAQVRVEQGPVGGGGQRESGDLRLAPLLQSEGDVPGPHRGLGPPRLEPRPLYPLAGLRTGERLSGQYEWLSIGPFTGAGREVPGLTRFELPARWTRLPRTPERGPDPSEMGSLRWGREEAGTSFNFGPTGTGMDDEWTGVPVQTGRPPSSAALQQYQDDIIAASPLFGPTKVLPDSVSPLQASSVKALARLWGRDGLRTDDTEEESAGLPSALRSDPRVLGQEYAATAAEYLRKGEYYRAVSYYDIALTVDPEGGRLHLGQGHALLGAGEYFSALRRLERAFALSPVLVRSGVDLNESIGDAELLQRRRAYIETALQRREDHRFRFLLGYMEYYSGFERVGRENLERAADAAPEDSFIARFPALLESGGADIDIPTEISPIGLPE